MPRSILKPSSLVELSCQLKLMLAAVAGEEVVKIANRRKKDSKFIP
jgi:hypothetical protein